MSKLCLFVFAFCFLVQILNVASIDYGDALTKSLLYFEAQRSGKLPKNQRVQWRGDSALGDGKSAGIDLVGGYYDAGDNVKFGFPMAFTVTMLSWSLLDFVRELNARRELPNAIESIKWGTDYLIKAHPQPNVLYGEVGDGQSDHECWQRPEDMTTPRTVFRIDEQHPGADLAGETAAAFASASIAFSRINRGYSNELLNHAKQLFEFAKAHTGQYQGSIPAAGQFYSSSGYEDELLWAAAWLHLATNDSSYIDFIAKWQNTGGTRERFSWDDKFAGAQILVAKGILEGKISGKGNLGQMKNNAEQFICNVIQKGTNNVKKTNGGLLWFLEGGNLQYVTSASFLITAYANSLAKAKSTIRCAGGVVGPQDLVGFAKSQVDYILGSNPKQISYMVGFGSNFPKRVHHRAASIVSIKKDSSPVGCKDGYTKWFNNNAENPNVIVGAVVGGPNQGDGYTDSRDNYSQAEPATVFSAPLVGVLAKLAGN
ncbi:endoglucanase 12 [Phtheirospermum japonicum]|uniref:Endoglucanase n=1 Tax=Phtheirospermum japonicum TaxID=374723 RepID=A0A830CUI5_9LAMI|nr:endoglucanase 12 [Phtheirospermum japonicum]